MPSFVASRLETAARYWHTLRHLRWTQIAGRVRHRLIHPRIDVTTPVPPVRRLDTSPWVRPASRAPSMVGPSSFSFLNETGSLDRGWDDPRQSKLWLYNLHYFDDLNARDAQSRAEWHAPLIARWVAENPPTEGSGWEPYPTSLRIVNWIKWAWSGGTLSPDAARSLAVQARWLATRLETHLLGNHLFANAKALMFAGIIFDGPEADGWRRTATEILRREVPEQILADGGHFELSTMYHALAVEDMLDLRNALTVGGASLTPPSARETAEWMSRIPSMLGWLEAMTLGDGAIGFFNDAAFGIAATNAELHRYARDLEIANDTTAGSRAMEASGYVRLERGDVIALLDVARVGPDYLPGHAHADTLTFELSLGEERVIVNLGTSVYGTSAERQRQRSTASHNTVVIDRRDSSEVWAGFRVARRAYPIDVRIDLDAGRVSAGHDGYRRLAGCPTHRRAWALTADGLAIEDSIDGRFGSAEARLHLHPEVKAWREIDGTGVMLETRSGRRLRVETTTDAVDVVASTWHPEFGKSMPNLSIVAHFKGPALRTTVRLLNEARGGEEDWTHD